MAGQPSQPQEQRPDRAQLREQLADLEHQQWMAWTQHLAATETLTTARLARWQAQWQPYPALSDAAKEKDRVFADRVLALLEEFGLLDATTTVANGATGDQR